MPAKAKPQCGRGHTRPPGASCPECSRERSLKRYYAKKDEINLQRNNYRRGKYKSRVHRNSDGQPICYKGHVRQEGVACQQCRVESKRESNGGLCKNGHPLTGRRCEICVKEYQRKWHAKHREELRQKALANYYQRREQGLVKPSTEGTRKWREANRERDRELRTVHQARRRARIAGGGGSHTPEEWRAILEAHEHKCAHCGFDGKLTKDHIEPIKLGGSDFAWNLQPLCGPCNSRKGAKLKETISGKA